MDEVDVVVVGGGLAGCATALHLARRGVSTRVLDRATFPREKVCGEGLMPHGVAELAGLGLLDAVREAGAQPFRGIAYHAGSLRAVGRFPGEGGLGVRRHVVDALWVHALDREPLADHRQSVRVTDVQWHADAVIVHTAEGAVRARAVVGADGLHSLVRRKAGLRGRAGRGRRYGVRVHLELPPGRRAPDHVEVFMQGGREWYITPSAPDAINLALLCGPDVTQGFAGGLDAAFLELARETPGIDAWVRGSRPLNAVKLTGPLRQRVRSAVAARTVLVGDAAGFIDAISGEGMSLSLIEARLAAEVLADALSAEDLSVRALRPYERRRKRASRDLIALTELILFGVRQPVLARWVVRNLARFPATFDKVLAVTAGQRRLTSLAGRDLVRLVAGV